ncbi:MAG TPA: zinc ribbon domain-containing protein [Vicinamibacterales bacterium]|jgi:putative FmdB family regulatory protein|nr:zinc ribbon domain-containing protein [Vicinamibacterales bacterium]
MPLYEYQCDSCGARFERIQKFSDPPVETCPTCGGPVHKLVSSPAFQFKGTGWYVTDYGKSGGSSSSASEKAGAANGGAKAEKTESSTKTDSASPTKTETAPAKSSGSTGTN